MNLYEFAIRYLNEHGVENSVLDEYLVVEKVDSLDKAFARGVASVNDQNKKSMSNPISYHKTERKKAIDEILCNLNLKDFLEKYGDDVDKLWNDLCSHIVPDKPQSTNGAWYKFAKNIITLAQYLADFESIDDWYKQFDNALTVDKKIAVATDISKKISQWGFTMSSNWIKDMGVTGYCKPDQHVCAIIDGIYSVGNDEKTIFAKTIEVADKCNVSPFALDRVLYLTGSGNFWNHAEISKNYNGDENEFISLFKAQI